MDSASALNELRNYQNSQRSATDIYEQESKALGVNDAQARQQDLRRTLRGTEQALRGVESSVTGRTQGSLVTEAQRSRLAALERQPIAEQFQTQQGALSDEESLYRDLLGKAGTRAGLEYQTQSDKLKSLQYGYEQAIAKEQAQRSFDEQVREFNANLDLERRKAAASEKSGIDIGSILASLKGDQTPQPSLSSIFGGALNRIPGLGQNPYPVATNRGSGGGGW